MSVLFGHLCLTLCNSMNCCLPASSVHFLLQRIFLTQGSNPGLLHCRQILYHLSHQESPIFDNVGAPLPNRKVIFLVQIWNSFQPTDFAQINTSFFYLVKRQNETSRMFAGWSQWEMLMFSKCSQGTTGVHGCSSLFRGGFGRGAL